MKVPIAEPLIADVMDPAGLLAAVDGRKADVVVHALTALKKAPVRHRPAGRRGGILEGGSKLPVSRRVARFNRRFLNPVFLRLAGHLPGFGIVSHVGRKSGRAYRTPVNAFRTDDGYIIALTYGSESDWVKNVLVAGSCELRTRGRRVRLSNPRIETDEDKGWAPLPVRFVLNRIDAPEYMRLWW